MRSNPFWRSGNLSRNQKQYDTCLRFHTGLGSDVQLFNVHPSRTEEPEHETVDIYQKKGPGF